MVRPVGVPAVDQLDDRRVGYVRGGDVGTEQQAVAVGHDLARAHPAPVVEFHRPQQVDEVTVPVALAAHHRVLEAGEQLAVRAMQGHLPAFRHDELRVVRRDGLARQVGELWPVAGIQPHQRPGDRHRYLGCELGEVERLPLGYRS